MPKKPSIKVQDIINSPLFAGVPPMFLKNVPKYCTVQEVAQGTTMIKEGDTGDSMFIIVQGQVDVFKGPKMIKLATLGSGVFVGEGALVSGAPRNATVVAASPVKLAHFDKAGFDKLVTIHSAIPITLMKTHTERCKSVVKTNGNVFGKSKKVIGVFAILGAILFIKYGGDAFNIESLKNISKLIPDEFMALFGPLTGAIMVKFQNMFIGDIVTKIEKL